MQIGKVRTRLEYQVIDQYRFPKDDEVIPHRTYRFLRRMLPEERKISMFFPRDFLNRFTSYCFRFAESIHVECSFKSYLSKIALFNS